MKHKCVWMNKRYVRILRIAFSVILRFTASDYVSSKFSYIMIARIICGTQGRIQDLKLGGAHLKKLRRPEWGAKIFEVFRVKNHDFTPKIIIFQFKAPPPPPWIHPWDRYLYRQMDDYMPPFWLNYLEILQKQPIYIIFENFNDFLLLPVYVV